jgi:hypothetical protein
MQKGMNATNVQTDTLFLLDRNVVSVLKIAIAGNEQKGEKEQRMLDFLRGVDSPQYAISPLPSLMEGEHGREDNVTEKTKQVEKETEAVASIRSHPLPAGLSKISSPNLRCRAVWTGQTASWFCSSPAYTATMMHARS